MSAECFTSYAAEQPITVSSDLMHPNAVEQGRGETFTYAM